MSKLNPIAQSLNEQLEKEAPEVLGMLSEYGRRLYFPKGIISQTAEAKQKATRFNATIGIATEGEAPMILPSIAGQIGDVSAQDAVTYAPPPGRPGRGWTRGPGCRPGCRAAVPATRSRCRRRSRARAACPCGVGRAGD